MVLTALVLSTAALGSPSSAHARPHAAATGSSQRLAVDAPTVRPRKPMALERTSFNGELPGRKRPVTLQRKAGGSWQPVVSGRTTKKGRYSLTAAGRAGTYRVSAPRVGSRSAVTTRSVKMRIADQTVQLAEVRSPFIIGSQRAVVVDLSPARRLRTVVLQRRDGAGWTDLDTSRSANTGRAQLVHVGAETGTATYRVVAKVYRGAKAHRSRTTRIRTADPVEHVSAGGPPDNVSYDPTLSGDGRYLAFTSRMPLLPGDSDATEDVYVFDRVTGGLSLEMGLVIGHVNNPYLSHDGRFLAFQTNSPNLADEVDSDYDVFVLDRTTGEVDLVSATPEGAPGNGNSYVHAISGDGRTVAFTSTARDLVTVFPPPAGPDLRHAYLRDRDSNLSRALDRKGAEWSSQSIYELDLSADGSRVAFSSSDLDLDPGSVNGSAVYAWDIAPDGRITGRANLTPGVNASGPVLSGDGSVVAFTSTNGLDPDDNDALRDAYVLRYGEISAVGPVLDGRSQPADVSTDGRHVLLATEAVVEDDTNGDDWDLGTWDLVGATFALLTAAGPGDSSEGQLSTDNTVVGLASSADLTPGSGNGSSGVYAVVTR